MTREDKITWLYIAWVVFAAIVAAKFAMKLYPGGFFEDPKFPTVWMAIVLPITLFCAAAPIPLVSKLIEKLQGGER